MIKLTMFILFYFVVDSVVQQLALDSINLSTLMKSTELLLASSGEEYTLSTAECVEETDQSMPIAKQLGIGFASEKMSISGMLSRSRIGYICDVIWTYCYSSLNNPRFGVGAVQYMYGPK